MKGYHDLPGSYQSPTPRKPADRSGWCSCERCGKATPAEESVLVMPDGTRELVRTGTYVCAHCGHCHVGVPSNNEDTTAQIACHECGSDLQGAYQCPKCGFPRAWMTVACPYCGNRQPVHAPHWVVRCDVFVLDCVRCDSRFKSLCIC